MTAVTAWPPHAAGPETAATLNAQFTPGQGWALTNAPERLYATIHGLLWFAEQLGCVLICPTGICQPRCPGHMPYNPQPGERIAAEGESA